MAGLWVRPGGGAWGEAAHWQNGLVAAGVGEVAEFTSPGLARDAVITVDVARTVGRLKFLPIGGESRWTLRPGVAGGLTLAATGDVPVIEVVGGEVVLGVGISGQQGWRKTGPGTVVLARQGNWGGGLEVMDGSVRLASPPMFPASMKILPLGDSITYGFNGSNAGYRGFLHDLMVPVCPDFRFVGTSTRFPGALPSEQRSHDGRPSYRIMDIHNNLDGFDDSRYQEIGGDARNPNGGYWLTGGNGTSRLPVFPDVFTLMAGTNDLADPAGVAGRLRMLLDKITLLRPDALVLVARITPLSEAVIQREGIDVAAYQAVVEAVVGEFRAAGKKVRLVDLHGGFPADGLDPDGVHPNDVGFRWMALQWHEAIIDAFSPAGGVAAPLPMTAPVTVGAVGRLELAGTWARLGNLTVHGTLDLGDGGVLDSSGAVLEDGAAVTGSGMIGGVVSNDSSWVVGNGQRVVFSDQVTNHGRIEVAAGGEIEFAGGMVNHGTIVCRGPGSVSFGGEVINQGAVRLTDGAPWVAAGAFTNYGTLDILTGGQVLPAGFVNLGEVIDRRSLVIRSAGVVGGEFVIRMMSHTGHLYQLEQADEPGAAEWIPVGVAQAGNTGSEVRLAVPKVGLSGFFRVRVSP